MNKPFNASSGAPAQNRLRQLEKTDPERALLRYAESGDLAGVQRVLAGQVDVDAVLYCNSGVETVEDTALHAAAGAGHVDIVEALIRAGAEANIRINDHETPLIHAAMNGWSQTTAALLRGGAKIDLAESFEGCTALHWASRMGHESTVRVLLDAGADMDVEDKRGATPEEVICAQVSTGHKEYQQMYNGIAAAFREARESRRLAAENAHREKTMLAEALKNAPVLQKEIPVGKPLRLKPRKP